jgi:TolA-binding protein
MYTTLGSAFLSAKRYNDAESTLKEFADKFPGSEQVPESYMMLADGYAEQERFEPAIEMYERVANDYGQSASGRDAAERAQETRLQYGSYLAATNQVAEAVRQFKAVTASNLIEQALFMMAGVLAQAGQYDEADVELRDFMARFPDSPLKPDVLSRLADIQMQGEKYDEAEKTLKEFFALPIAPTNPILPAGNLQLAFCKYYQNDNEGMGTVLTNILAAYPDAPEAGEALYWLAYLKRMQPDYRAAGELYQELLRRYPAHPYAAEAAYQVGETALLDNNAAGAIAAFTNVYCAYSDSVFAPYALMRAGEIYLDLRQLPAWLDALAALPAASPAQRAARTLARAAILMRAGDTTNAAATLDALPREQLPAPLQGYGLAVRAGIENARGAAAPALDAARQATALLQDAPVGRDEALFQRARAEKALKDWEAAEQTYATLTGDVTVPNNAVAAEAYIERADCLMKLDRTDEVVEVVDAGIKLRPPVELAARGVVMKGDAMMQQNEYKKAAQFYKRAVILYGKLQRYAVPAYQGLILAYTKLGLTEDAAQVKQQFAQQYPNAPQP